MRMLVVSVVIALAVVAGAACSLPLTLPAPTMQAPGFQYVERPRLQSAMWTLADCVTALDHLLGPEMEAEVPQQQVIAILESA